MHHSNHKNTLTKESIKSTNADMGALGLFAWGPS